LKIYTIGFTKTTAERFFNRLVDANVATLVDTRLHRDGQLSGFAKMPDLKFFLTRLTRARYQFEALLAPAEADLKAYKRKEISWAEYEIRYRDLLRDRRDGLVHLNDLDGLCLLCSEDKADRCHRRLAAEFLRDTSKADDLEIIHL
jgi:uncharacterized protein (DUF488 family)